MSAHRAYADHDPVDYLSSGWNNSVGWHDETTFNYGGIDFGYRAVTHTYAYGDGTLYFDDVEADFAYPTGGGEYGWWAQYYLWDEDGMIHQVTFVFCHEFDDDEYYDIAEASSGYGGSFYPTSERWVRISDESDGCSELEFEAKHTIESNFVW